MTRCVGVLLLAWLPALHAATAHLELDVALDPNTRLFRAQAELTTSSGAPDLSLDPLFRISRVALDGAEIPADQLASRGKAASPRSAASRTPQRWSIAYSGTLPPLPEGERRNSPNAAALFASPEGSYLSPNGNWYPDPGVPFTYRVKVSLPAGQKALAPGNQRRVSDNASGFSAEYEFAQPAEGVWLMAGPYEVAEQSLRQDGGRTVTVRTWFHPELAGLASGYLRDSVRYLQRYSRSIGDYPFEDFSIVSSPLSHGLGMPSLTYLGRDVLRLPFIRATSLGHEVLHNWWGNGVYPDWASGNWSEGLTTFMADYAFREDESEAAAREMRLNWLRDLAAVAPADETSLADFKARQHGISSVVGYGKSAMVFFMLRDEIGRAAFDAGIRSFWQQYRFRTASWNDLQAAFSRAAGRDLSRLFAQWVRRPASPRLALAAGADGQRKNAFRLLQQGDPFELQVPLRVRLASGETRELTVRVRERETPVGAAAAPLPADAIEVELDPDLRLWRRLDPRTVPPIFRDVFISPRAEVLLANQGAAWTTPARALANRLLDAPPREVQESGLRAAAEVPALVLGDPDSIARVAAGLNLGGVPDIFFERGAASPQRSLKGSARAWTARAPNGKTIAFVMADGPDALAALQRSLPHYGRQSWLVFQEGRMVEQGAWPVAAQKLPLR
jgi:aminopeptidase N